jgi:hypothetical protein
MIFSKLIMSAKDAGSVPDIPRGRPKVLKLGIFTRIVIISGKNPWMLELLKSRCVRAASVFIHAGMVPLHHVALRTDTPELSGPGLYFVPVLMPKYSRAINLQTSVVIAPVRFGRP